MNPRRFDPYEVLGVDALAGFEEIRAAFKRRAFETHPDRNKSNDEFSQVAEAYKILTCPERRHAWDAHQERDTIDDKTAQIRLAASIIQQIGPSKNFQNDALIVLAEKRKQVAKKLAGAVIEQAKIKQLKQAKLGQSFHVAICELDAYHDALTKDLRQQARIIKNLALELNVNEADPIK